MLYVAFTRLSCELLGLGPFRQPDGCHLPFQGRREKPPEENPHKSNVKCKGEKDRPSRHPFLRKREPFCLLRRHFLLRKRAKPSRHPSGATLPFKEGEAKVCTFGAIITSSLRDTPSNRGNYLSREPSNQRTFLLPYLLKRNRLYIFASIYLLLFFAVFLSVLTFV